jgi:predicted TIM-barrel fold metal-dependent hydrolase
MTNHWKENITRYVSIIKEVQKAFKTYDVHIHPTEIIYNVLNYREDPAVKGLFTLGKMKYRSPSLENLRQCNSGQEAPYTLKEYQRIIPMLLQKIYFHTGPKVFTDYFDILGIDKALLLPVAPGLGSIDEQMATSYRMFKDEKRFWMAGSVPNTVRNEGVESFLREQIRNYGIVAVKIHPNVTGINLGIPEGKERVECIIRVSDQLGLPVIIHGGRNDVLNNENGRFAEISKFTDINWKSSVPVIIAHGGAYGFSLSEVVNDIIPILKKLLSLHENLSIDISGLPEGIILSFLSFIDTERILFGSDALYENAIVAAMRLLYALEQSGSKLERSLIQILSENAARTIFREDPKKRVGTDYMVYGASHSNI